MKHMKNLALLSLGLLMASANAATRYNGTWALSTGESGSLAVDMYGSTFTGTMATYWPSPSLTPLETATVSGTYTGHRFKMLIAFNTGSMATFQGNIKFSGNRVRMDGLRYFGDRPDVKTRLSIDVGWVYLK